MSALYKKYRELLNLHPVRTTTLTLVVLVLVFLSPGLLPGRFLAPVNIFNFTAPYLDITTQMLPWYKISKEILLSGHFPFWNVYSGLGLPLFANMQSAVLFPLTWIFYVLNLKWALFFYSFIKLLLTGLFTFLYLRELKLKYYSALVGATIFSFCGANAIWFLWPFTNILMLLPLSFFLIEKFFSTRKNIFLWLLAPITTLMVFGGHPQTFFYVFFVVAAYAIFKIITNYSGKKIFFQQLTGFAASFALGIFMSAVALLPFLEYLKLSANLIYRASFTENPFFLPKLMLIANLIPDFYGNPGIKHFSYVLAPNYAELALGYAGITALILAAFAFYKSAKKEIWFFGGSLLFLAMLIYKAPVIYYLINKLPGFNLNYNNRLLYIWAFFVSVLAAFGLERLQNGEILKKRFNYTWACLAVIGLVLFAANRVATKHWQFPHDLTWHIVSLWQIVVFAGFTVNVLIAYFVLKNFRKWRHGLLILFALVFAETGLHGMVFTTTSNQQNFYPALPVLKFLQDNTLQDNSRVFMYGHNFLANIGDYYHINEFTDHDAMYLQTNKELKQQVANFNYSPEYTFDEPNLKALEFLGVKYLVYNKTDAEKFYQTHQNEMSVAYQDDNYEVLKLFSPLPKAYIIPADNAEEAANYLKYLINNDTAPVLNVSDYLQQQDGTQTLSASFGMNGYLILANNYYPGWEAQFSSGGSAKIENIYGLQGVKIPAGEHQVKIFYTGRSFYLGLEISLAALFVWLLTLYFTKKT